MQEIGQEIKKVALKSTPTLIKYADRNEYLVKVEEQMKALAEKHLGQERFNNNDPVVLIDYDKEAESKIAAALLYKHTQLPYQQILDKVRAMDEVERQGIIEAAMKDRGDHDQAPRELEHADYTFDILLDYGAFRDVQRHRICTQTNQTLTCDYGYVMPDEVTEAGLDKQYQECIKKAEEAYNQMKATMPDAASYIVPLAFRKRVLITWNLRELHHFISLRSSKQGHPSYRKIAQLTWEELDKIQPFLAKFIRVDKTEAIPPRVIKLGKGDEGYTE